MNVINSRLTRRICPSVKTSRWLSVILFWAGFMLSLRIGELAIQAGAVPGAPPYVLALQADELKVGDAVPVFSARDQFGKEFKLAAGLRFLLVGFDMGAGKAANLKLADLGAGWLENHGAATCWIFTPCPASRACSPCRKCGNTRTGSFSRRRKVCSRPFRASRIASPCWC